jgi:hypothetical protein
MNVVFLESAMRLPIKTPSHVDEPQQAQEYADVMSKVAAEHHAVIVRRGGADLAAIIPLEYLEFLLDSLAMQEAERIAAELDWDRLVKANPPPQAWFDRDELKPF